MDTILKKFGNETMCTAAIFVKDNKVLLGLRHYDDRSVWTTPGGRCDNGELIEKSLLRETEEETGFKDVTITQYLGTVESERHPQETVDTFLCTTEEECCLAEPEKFSEWKWFREDEIPDNFINKALLLLIPFTK